jgi:hypothetical protein
VRWSGPAAPTCGQAGGAHATAAFVVERPLTLPLTLANGAASSEASPRTVNDASPLLASSTVNSTWALRTVASAGMSTLAKRSPMTCSRLPSSVISMSLLVSPTEPLDTLSSASSSPLATRLSNDPAPETLLVKVQTITSPASALNVAVALATSPKLFAIPSSSHWMSVRSQPEGTISVTW